MPHFSCCERVQPEKRIHRMGSFQTFAAICMEDRLQSSGALANRRRVRYLSLKPLKFSKRIFNQYNIIRTHCFCAQLVLDLKTHLKLALIILDDSRASPSRNGLVSVSR